MPRNSEKSKLEFRDVDAPDETNYLTKSRAQVDLETRTEDGYVPDSAVGGVVTVNPNPFGEDEYVGTDPIYQNYATDHNKPLAAEEGVEAEQLEAHREMHEVDGDREVEDYGLGGTAERAEAGTAARTYRTVLPGQEGYNLQKAQEQNGPPLRVYADDDTPLDEGSDGVTEVPVPGTNFGATTESPDPEDGPSDKAGSRTGNE